MPLICYCVMRIRCGAKTVQMRSRISGALAKASLLRRKWSVVWEMMVMSGLALLSIW